MKRIILNGQPRDTDAQDVRALVGELGFAKGTVLIEYNGKALHPNEWSAPINDGDQIEALRIVAGG